MIYRCYLLDKADRIAGREHFHAEDDNAATDRTREFLFQVNYAAAELWVSSRLVVRLDNEGKPT